MKVTLPCLALFSLMASGQTFEVATVKPAAPDASIGRLPPGLINSPAGDDLRFRGGPGSRTPERIDYVSVTLQSLLQRAYGVKSEQISGPGWLADERYDITATMAPGTNAEQLKAMLQQLIAERFQLNFHRDTKSMRVYLLTVAKGGPKLKPGEAPPEYKDDEARLAARQAAMASMLSDLKIRSASGPYSYFSHGNGTMAELANSLTSHVDRPVKDRTGLAGKYSYRVEWTPGNPPNASGPSIYAAVEEQLGLKLQAETEQMEMLVIDKAERVPTSN